MESGIVIVRALAIAALVAACLLTSPASADGCDADATAEGNVFAAAGECSSDGASSSNENEPISATTQGYYTDFRWKPACTIAVGPVHTCSTDCPNGQIGYQKEGLHDGTWFPLDYVCASNPPESAVSPADVARAFQRIPLPALRARTQPADKTLINFDTIFFVDAAPLHRTLTLLGQRVDLEITPNTFRWVHGDGTTAVTQTPGAAYPAKDVVHRYQHAHVTVEHHVEIVWTARWSLNGGPYQDVAGTVTTVGPNTPLQIAEATPALSGYGH